MGDDVARMVARVRDDRSQEAEAALCAEFLPVARVFFRRHALAADVDDLAQEAVLVLLTAAREGKILDDHRAGGFLVGVCRNLVRRGARRDERAARALARLDLPPVDPHNPIVDARRLWTCFNALSARARDVLSLTYVDEIESMEIATRMATSEGNVRVIRHRALHALHACLEGAPHA